jgi:polyphosphate kinase
VSIDLIARLAASPGVRHRDNIRVISIVDRFLEHARIFHLATAASARSTCPPNWMPTNFQRRIEGDAVDDEGLRDRVIDEILAIALKDNVERASCSRTAVRSRTPSPPPTARPEASRAASTGSGTRARKPRPTAARHRRRLPRPPGRQFGPGAGGNRARRVFVPLPQIAIRPRA